MSETQSSNNYDVTIVDNFKNLSFTKEPKEDENITEYDKLLAQVEKNLDEANFLELIDKETVLKFKLFIKQIPEELLKACPTLLSSQMFAKETCASIINEVVKQSFDAKSKTTHKRSRSSSRSSSEAEESDEESDEESEESDNEKPLKTRKEKKSAKKADSSTKEDNIASPKEPGSPKKKPAKKVADSPKKKAEEEVIEEIPRAPKGGSKKKKTKKVTVNPIDAVGFLIPEFKIRPEIMCIECNERTKAFDGQCKYCTPCNRKITQRMNRAQNAEKRAKQRAEERAQKDLTFMVTARAMAKAKNEELDKRLAQYNKAMELIAKGEPVELEVEVDEDDDEADEE